MKPKKSRLSNNAINFIVDCVMLVSFLSVLCIAAIVQFIFPPASRSEGTRLWGMALDGWVSLLGGSLAIFAVLVLLHVILHWSWVCTFVTSRLTKAMNRRIVLDESSKTLWGVGTLIVVLTAMGIVIAAAEFCIQTPSP